MSNRTTRSLLRGVLIVTLLLSWLSVGTGPVAHADDISTVPVQTVSDTPDRVLPTLPYGQSFVNEIEPNNFYTTAMTLPSTNLVLLGNVYPNADVDYYVFTANAGDRLYAATQTSFSANANTDSVLDLYAADGTTSIESDNDDGSLGSLSSSIAGAVLPATGSYYLRVRHNSTTSQLRPYQLHVRVQSGAPTVEVEPNNDIATAQPLPPSGWITGTIAITTDVDFYAVTLNAGDTVYASLDLDPERDGVDTLGRLGVGVFNNFLLVVNDAGTSAPDSEAMFQTVREAGTYYVYVDNGVTSGTGTYQLSVNVHPAEAPANCTTYTSTNVPLSIPAGPGIVTSTLTVPGNPAVADIDVSVLLTHTNMIDLDVHLVSPAGNDNGLFTDIGSNTQQGMNLTLDDEAAYPISVFSVVSGMIVQPELNYRLSWYDGSNAGGVWSLVLRDDLAANDGALLGWSIRVCEPTPPPTCPIGTNPVTVFATDFEADDGGFTHGGTQDEWERGLPTFVPITTCNSGTNCWKTDLDSTYNASANMDLTRTIDLANVVGPVRLNWAQRFHMENASFDHAVVAVQPTIGGPAQTVWEWLDATMNDTIGNPSVTIGASAGWARLSRDISGYAGQSIDLKFHLDSDTTINLAGLAIDDVSIEACKLLSPPVADAGLEQVVTMSDNVTLDGSASFDPDNALPLTYHWNQAGGPAVTLSNAAAVSPTFTAPSTPAIITFTLVVTDNTGLPSTPDSVTVTVIDEAIIGLTAANDGPTVLGNTTAFSATQTSGTNITYLWDFGDGQSGSGTSTTHQYAAVETYTATVTATNSLGSVVAQTVIEVLQPTFYVYLPLILR